MQAQMKKENQSEVKRSFFGVLSSYFIENNSV